jgi:magnesium chelatase family protein
MPDMTFDEALEVTKIHSVAGELSEDGIVSLRPFRTPHHTATTVSLCGGGNMKIRAGEISKAHKGVLFLDELPEYTRSALEALRQPLEDKVITVTRAGGAITFPADFILCASMNPCPCGNYGSSERACTCSPSQIRKYRSKISGPLLDRIDLQVEVDSVKYEDLASDSSEEPSAEIKKRVERARAIQRERFLNDGITVNANMGEKQIKQYCRLTPECERILKQAFETLSLSARARSRIIKVARTIADLDYSSEIKPEHILEAASYRNFDSRKD